MISSFLTQQPSCEIQQNTQKKLNTVKTFTMRIEFDCVIVCVQNEVILRRRHRSK